MFRSVTRLQQFYVIRAAHHSVMVAANRHAGVLPLGLVLILPIIFLSCTTPAEHGNPLDPLSPAFSESAKIEGTVTSYYAPFRPLSNVEIRLASEPALAFTDNQGNFFLTNLRSGDYELQATLAGYAVSRQKILLNKRQTLALTIPLNGLPRVDSATVITERRVLATNSTRYFLQVENVMAGDPDGINDIKRVVFMAPDFNFTDTLALVDRARGRWRRQFRPEELPGATPLPEWPGHPLSIQIEDLPGHQTIAGPFYIARVIQETPEVIAPNNNAVITAAPLLFQWRVATAPFPYTQEIEIQDVLDPDSRTILPGIPPGTTAKNYSGGGLPPAGTYVWTVKIVDEFGNSSRSRPAAFQVQ